MYITVVIIGSSCFGTREGKTRLTALHVLIISAFGILWWCLAVLCLTSSHTFEAVGAESAWEACTWYFAVLDKVYKDLDGFVTFRCSVAAVIYHSSAIWGQRLERVVVSCCFWLPERVRLKSLLRGVILTLLLYHVWGKQHYWCPNPVAMRADGANMMLRLRLTTRYPTAFWSSPPLLSSAEVHMLKVGVGSNGRKRLP